MIHLPTKTSLLFNTGYSMHNFVKFEKNDKLLRSKNNSEAKLGLYR